MRIRLFIALPISHEIRKRCEALEEIGRQKTSSIRWVDPEQIHLTLFFLGWTDPALQPKIETQIREAARESAPFSAQVTGLGVFPKPSSPKVFWVGVSNEPTLLALQENLSARMGGLGFSVETRPYRPHLTLGRMKGPVPEAFKRWVTEGNGLQIGRCEMETVMLMESRMRPEGSIYTPLFTTALGGAPRERVMGF
jgi:2'-5' RNA ligase